MNHFNNSLPDEIIVHIFRSLLSDNSKRMSQYKTLHLVCKRWRLVCVGWANHLPKRERSLTLVFDDVGCRRGSYLTHPQCTNFNGCGVGPKLLDMLRHYDMNEKFQLLEFKGKFCCNNALLLFLIQHQLTSAKSIIFPLSNMSGVTEEVLTAFFATVASSKRFTNLYLYLHDLSYKCSTNSIEAVSDRSLAPLITSSVLETLSLSTDSMNPWRSVRFAITDQTLINLALHFPRNKFEYHLESMKEVTAHGIRQLIEAFCDNNCHVQGTSQLSFRTIPAKLKAELFKLCAPTNIFRHYNIEHWIYKRSPSHSFPDAILKLNMNVDI